MLSIGALEIASLTAGVVGAIVGIIAVGISFGFFRAGHEVSIATLKALAEIGKSTHATEASAIPIINKMLELLSSGVAANLELGKASVEEQVERILKGDPAIAEDDEAISRIKRAILSELSTVFNFMEYKASSMAPIARDRGSEGAGILRVTASSLPPAVPRVVHWMAKNEQRYEYFSVKYLRNRIFQADPAAQEAVQYCIDTGMFSISQRENPKNPDFPTTTCKLNRGHPAIEEVLAEASME